MGAESLTQMQGDGIGLRNYLHPCAKGVSGDPVTLPCSVLPSPLSPPASGGVSDRTGGVVLHRESY